VIRYLARTTAALGIIDDLFDMRLHPPPASWWFAALDPENSDCAATGAGQPSIIRCA